METLNLIPEAQFAQKMKNEIEPFLEKVRQCGYFSSFDGNKIHYEAYTKDDAKAAVVIFHGFTETAEKFREMSYYFYTAGYSVFAADLRGHGLSYRIKANEGTVKADSFDDYAKDTDFFVRQVVKTQTGSLPLYAYSHSLGSTVLLLYMMEFTGAFSKLVLSSPMICGNMGMPVSVAGALASVLCAIGAKGVSVPGKCRFDPEQTAENSDDTSESRFSYYHEKRLAQPLYRTSGPSFGWVWQSLKAKDFILSDENCKKLNVPVLMFKPESDRQVLSSYQDKFAEKVSDIQVKNIKGAKHEIFGSTNDVLEKYLTDILDFFEN
ncbi:MAG: alpha/beta hydrolase [Acutalibacteraceae bacterium]